MKKVVLLVDDTATGRALQKVAVGGDFAFLEAENGQIALDIAEERRPDCILLDVVMPVMDGVEALRRLKANEATRAIPVIMVTSRSDEAVRIQCRNLGCDSFVTKPFDREELRVRLREALGMASDA